MKAVTRLITLLVSLAIIAGCRGEVSWVPTGTSEVPVTVTSPRPTLVPVAPPEASPTVVNTPVAASETQPAGSESYLNPLTGLSVHNSEYLLQNPLIVKIQNVPRESRPQWGLSLADHVYEYFIEHGDTRFAAVYYSEHPEQVGPVRSARHIDMQIIQMYKGVLLFGGAYEELMETMLSSKFGKSLIREGPNTVPAFFRYEPKGVNALMVNTTLLGPIYEKYGIVNEKPDLTPLVFSAEAPAGAPADVVFTRFSGSMYNRWDYDPATGRYYRSSETVSGFEESYAPLYDQATGKQVAADNLVVLMTRYNQVENENQVFDVPMMGEGKAFAARDGVITELTWRRSDPGELIQLYSNEEPYALKPGTVWYSIFGTQSKVEQQERNWKFLLYMP